MTQASGERSVAIGGGVSNSAVVTGDHNIIQIVNEPVRRPRVDYAVRIKNFLYQYLGDAQHPVPFGGRDAALRALDAWLEAPDQPYALLTAPAGRGKSALLVRWLAALRARQTEEWKIVFVPVSVRYGTNLASVTFAALVAQLAQAFSEAAPTDPNTPDAAWRDLFGNYLQRPPPQGRLLVVLDGLDEAANWDVDAGLFPAQPPANLKVIVSARLTADCPQPDDWRRALGWERPPARCFDLAPLDLDGLRDVLQKMGAPLDALAKQSPIVEALYRLTEGDPLLVSLYAGDLWQRGEGIRHLRAEDLRDLHPSYAGYFKRWWNDQRRLWGEAWPLREPAVSEMLNLLSAALAPLRADDLLALASPALSMNSRLLEESLRPLARFVVKTGEGYVFAHPRLGAYFWEKLTEGERRTLEARFLAWGRGVLDDLTARRIAPRDAPPYLVRSYRAHLERAGAPMADLRRLVETHAWAQAWDALEGGFGGYLSDTQAVWRRAVQEDRQATKQGEPAPWLGLEARCALIEASVRSLAASLPPELPALLVRHGHWTPRQALVHVRQMPDEGQRAAALTQMLPYLPDELLSEALAAAREIEDERWRAEALGALAAHLSEPLRGEALSEALAAAREIEDERWRAEALGALAAHLSEPLRGEALSEALAAAREIKDEQWRAEALGALAAHLSEPLLAEVLAAAREIKKVDARVEVLTTLAERLPEVRPKVVAMARTIRYALGRSRALIALAKQMPELLPEARAAAQEIVHPVDRVCILMALAEQEPEIWLEALSLVQEMATIMVMTSHFDPRFLRDMAMRIPVELLDQVLAIAQRIDKQEYRDLILGILAVRMPTERSQEALAAAQQIVDPHERAEALTRLAARTPEMLPKALAVTQKIQDSFVRALALAALMPYLPTKLLSEVLTAVRESEERAYALTDLEDCLANKVLAVAWERRHVLDHASALTALAKRMPEIWSEVMSAGSKEDAEVQARIFATLPRQQAYPPWADTLPALACRTRKDLLSDLRALAPLIYALGGEQAAGEAFRAVQDVGAWWP